MENPPRFTPGDIVRYRPDIGVSLGHDVDNIKPDDLSKDETVLVKAWMRGVDRQLDKKVVQADMSVSDWQALLKKGPKIDIKNFEGKDGFWHSYTRPGFDSTVPVKKEDIESITTKLKGTAISSPAKTNHLVDESKVVTGHDMMRGMLSHLVEWKFPPKELERLSVLLGMIPQELMAERWVKYSDLPSLEITPQKKKEMTDTEKKKRLMGLVEKRIEKVCL